MLSAVLAIVNLSVCMSVRLSRAGTMSKRLQLQFDDDDDDDDDELRSCGVHWSIAP